MRGNPRDAVAADNNAITRTVVLLVWAFLTLLWSIFTPPHRTFAVRVLLFQPLWCIRVWLGDRTWRQDLALCLSLHAVYSYCVASWRLWSQSDFDWLDLNDHELWLYIKIFSLLGICGGLAGGIVHRGHQLKTPDQNGHLSSQRIDEHLLPPLLLPSRTTHSRQVPKRHSFSYSYMLVGVPVGLRGRISSVLSVDSQQRSWFDVRSADFLSRGNGHLGLAEKLKRYLHAQGVTDRDYSFAYLVTAPRFLGYSFNPVSFWYLYDSDTVLKYMILEVNNTFDERRMYLLRADDGKSVPEPIDESKPASGRNGLPKKLVFSETFDKDFHVSPFNSRNGSYSLRAVDPLAAYEETGRVSIDNTIVLRSSKETAKIVARVWTEGVARDVTKISAIHLTKFIAAWWWVGFLTFPRIVWEAQKLFFQRKLHVWYRPEVVQTSIGRTYTTDETQLETHFRAFIEDAVSHATTPLRLIYEPAHVDGEEIVMYSPGFTYEEDHKRTLTLQVTSPAFYSRFVHYAHAKEAFDRECLTTDEKNRTLTIGSPELLLILLEGVSTSTKSARPAKRNVLEQSRWSLLRRLRCPPPAASYPEIAGHSVSDIRSFGDAEIDRFVMRRGVDSNTYRAVVIKLFLASRFALGLPVLVSAVDVLLRSCLILATMSYCHHHPEPIDILRPRPRGWDLGDLWTIATTLTLANCVHIWSLIKG